MTKEEFLRVADRYSPGILLTYSYGNFFSRNIVRVSNRWKREKHEYAHAMDAIGFGEVATQNTFYVRKPLASYLNNATRVKLWIVPDLTGDTKAGILARIADELNAPWYKRIYDAPGLVGQWLGNTLGVGRKVNVPGIHYCSERTVRHWAAYLGGLRAQASPADIDRYCEWSEFWSCAGIYDPVEGA